MIDKFLKSLFVSPPLVLRRRLRPFSAFHLAGLQVIDSPFVTDAVPQIEDLVLAVHICRSRFRDAHKVMDPSDTDLLEIQKWGHVPDTDEDIEIFMGYLSDYLDSPDVESPSDAPESEMPVPFALVTTVITNIPGISEEVAWDMPFNRLVAYRTGIAEANGWRIVDEKLEELGKPADQIAADTRKAEEAKAEDTTDGP